MVNISGRRDQQNLERAGRYITQHASDIVKRWIEKVGVHPSTSSDHREHLRDHLPQLLARIGQDLAKGRREQGEAAEEMAEKHGEQRWILGWSLQDVVYDYQSLRPVLEDELKREFGDPLPSAVVSELSGMIDQSVAESLESYTEFQTEQEDHSHRTASEFAAIVSSSADAVISMSTEGEIQSWNRTAEEMYGHNCDEAIGKHISLIFPKERRLEVERMLERVNRNEAISGMDTVRQTKEGAKIEVAVSVSPICNRSGAVVGCASIERDVTDKARTAEALRRALEAAESAALAKTEFLANVSHNLRTPMNAIIGMAGLTLEEDLDEAARENLVTLRDAAGVMLRLVNDLLDISQFESGQLAIDQRPFSLRRVLDDAMRLVAVRAVHKGLKVSCRVDRNVPDRLCTDALRLQQILTNLIDNGVKFTDQGEVAVSVSLQACDRETCDLEFAVRDTGVGISNEDQRRIFTPFTQVDSSSTRRFSGSGLGLAIASHLAKRLGGELTLESKLGEGSVFWFRVQLHRSVAAIEDPKFAATAHHLRDVPILIVDRDETNLRIVSQIVRNWGMQPLEANEPRAALSQLAGAEAKPSSIRVVLIDALLREHDGFELANQIADDGNRAPIILLMISPSDRLNLREQCQSSQVDGFIDKPICESQLFDGIVEALSARSLTDDAQKRPPKISKVESPLRVLVVEDTEANRKVVTRTLEKRGHQFTSVVDGKEAVDRFQGETFDVVLMDVQMPVLDGFAATDAIREFESANDLQATPIIAMTAHAMRGDREKCLAAGMDDYITKPIDVSTLIDTLERAAGRGSANTQAATLGKRSKYETNQRLIASESVDLEAALRRLRGDRELLRELSECFFEDYQGILKAIDDALAQGDFETVAGASHKLKGLSSNFNAQSTPELAEALQHAASREDKATVRNLLPLLQQAAQELATQLGALK